MGQAVFRVLSSVRSDRCVVKWAISDVQGPWSALRSRGTLKGAGVVVRESQVSQEGLAGSFVGDVSLCGTILLTAQSGMDFSLMLPLYV